MAFLDELALNATKNNVGVVIYSGNDDALVAHTGSQGTVSSHLVSIYIAFTDTLISVVIQVRMHSV